MHPSGSRAANDDNISITPIQVNITRKNTLRNDSVTELLPSPRNDKLKK